MDVSAFPDMPPKSVADVLARLSTLMGEMQARDVRLQTTISDISKERTLASDEIEALQYLDLSTQIHGDLRRLLHALSGTIDTDGFDRTRLSETLKLGSLKRSLLSCAPDVDANYDEEETILL